MSGDHNMFASGSGDGQKSGWRKRTIMEMAREVIGDYSKQDYWPFFVEELERFAELVREDERNRTWTQEHWTEYENSIAAAEREACLKVCEEYDGEYDIHPKQTAEGIALQIRARGNKT